MRNLKLVKVSKRMAAIRSKNTRPELILRSHLWAAGFRYRLLNKLPGKPDIVLRKHKIAIFVDGDFWHGYKYEQLKPKLKNDYWKNKIKTNILRDKKVTKQLTNTGWFVIRFWEHDILKRPGYCINKVERMLCQVN